MAYEPTPMDEYLDEQYDALCRRREKRAAQLKAIAADIAADEIAKHPEKRDEILGRLNTYQPIRDH